MLKDPKWDLPNPWYTGEFKDIRTFYAFVLSKPADEMFYYPNPGVCSCGQYANEYAVYSGRYSDTSSAIELFNKFALRAHRTTTGCWVKWGTLAQVLSEYFSEEGYLDSIGEQSVEYVDA